MNLKIILWKLAYLFLSFAIFMIDQTTKAWAVRRLRLGRDMEIIPGFLNLSYAQNTGVAFSMFDDYGEAGRWALSSVGILVGVLVLYYFWRFPRSNDRLFGALALLLGGIAGNVVDRIRFGFVIDFIDFYVGSWHYPTFNVADVAIVAGAVLLIWDIYASKKEEAEIKKDNSVR